ncbi:MAG: hypothetical protein PF489_09060 [Salinivirgaceae bacterium]|jgi:hypothetical protein|nr:hypothetical protein [Salinivirgaceae bacterium]
MNDLVTGLTKIRNAILGGLILSIVFSLFQYIAQSFKNQNLSILIAFVYVLILILTVVYIVKYFTGIRLIRNLSIFEKLNKRLYQIRNNFRAALGFSIGSTSIILVGIVLPSVYVIYFGLFILVFGSVFGWIITYRTIQIQGILGVYAKNQDLIRNTIKTLNIFKIQIVVTIILYLALYFKSYSLYAYYSILTISIVYSIYFVVNYLGLFNLAINLFRNSQDFDS